MAKLDDAAREQWARLAETLREDPLGEGVLSQLRKDPDRGAQSLGRLLREAQADPARSPRLATVVADGGGVEKLVNIGEVVNVDARRVRHVRLTAVAALAVVVFGAGTVATRTDNLPFVSPSRTDQHVANPGYGESDDPAVAEDSTSFGPPIEVVEDGFRYRLELSPITRAVSRGGSTAPPGYRYLKVTLQVTNLQTDREAPPAPAMVSSAVFPASLAPAVGVITPEGLGCRLTQEVEIEQGMPADNCVLFFSASGPGPGGPGPRGPGPGGTISLERFSGHPVSDAVPLESLTAYTWTDDPADRHWPKRRYVALEAP